MLQQLSKHVPAIHVTSPESVSITGPRAEAPTFTAISYGAAARVLGDAIAAQYASTAVAAVTARERAAAKRFGAALLSLAALVG